MFALVLVFPAHAGLTRCSPSPIEGWSYFPRARVGVGTLTAALPAPLQRSPGERRAIQYHARLPRRGRHLSVASLVVAKPGLDRQSQRRQSSLVQTSLTYDASDSARVQAGLVAALGGAGGRIRRRSQRRRQHHRRGHPRVHPRPVLLVSDRKTGTRQSRSESSSRHKREMAASACLAVEGIRSLASVRVISLRDHTIGKVCRCLTRIPAKRCQ